MSSSFSVDFPEPTSDFQMPTKTQIVCILFLNKIAHEIVGVYWNVHFLKSAPVVSVLADRHIMQHHH